MKGENFMKTLLLSLICILILSNCKNNTKNEPVKVVSEEEAIKFVDAHLQKIINKEYDLAYDDYIYYLKNEASIEDIKKLFEQTMKEMYGELKGVEYKSIAYGKTSTIGGTLNTAALYYKADIEKPDTYVKVIITKISDEIKVVQLTYFNFVGEILPEWE